MIEKLVNYIKSFSANQKLVVILIVPTIILSLIYVAQNGKLTPRKATCRELLAQTSLSLLGDVTNAKVLGLIWTDFFGLLVLNNDQGCNSDCKYTRHRECLDEASILIFHAHDIDFNDLPPRRQDQKWAIFTWEAPARETWMQDFEKVRNSISLIF
jgi:hypothetical protein